MSLPNLMQRNETIAALFLIGAGVFLVSRADASLFDSFTNSSPDPINNDIPFGIDDNQPTDAIVPTTTEQRINAFAATIRQFEANDDYYILYGGGHFSDDSAHPNIRVPFWNPKTQKQDFSTAAGAYQINFPTWSKEIQPALHLPDFTPASQDAAALFLLRKLGVLSALSNDNIPLAFAKASGRWASLPGSTAQQNPQTLTAALNAYSSYLA